MGPMGILPVDSVVGGDLGIAANRLVSSWTREAHPSGRTASLGIPPSCPLWTWCEAIVLVASSRNSSLVFPSLMSFTRCAGIILTGAAILFSISCEKHHLGEYPEFQRDLTATLDKEASNPAPGGSAAPTPVKFFPEKKAP